MIPRVIEALRLIERVAAIFFNLEPVGIGLKIQNYLP